MKGNKTQIIVFNCESSTKRTRDAYGINEASFTGFHGFDFFQVKTGRRPDLVKVHFGEGTKGFYKGSYFLFLQFKEIFLEVGKIKIKLQELCPGMKDLFRMAYVQPPSDQRIPVAVETPDL